MEPAGRAVEPAGRASEQAGRDLNPDGGPFEPAGRPLGACWKGLGACWEALRVGSPTEMKGRMAHILPINPSCRYFQGLLRQFCNFVLEAAF